MINYNKIGLIFSMEFKKFLSNKKTLLIAFVVPILLVSFIVISITDIGKQTQSSTIGIVNVNSSINTLIDTYRSEKATIVSYENEQLLKDALSSSKCEAGLLVDEKVTIIYDSLSLPSDTILSEAAYIAEELNMSILGDDIYNSYINSKPQIDKYDISTEHSRTISEFQMLLTMVVIIIIMIVSLNVITLSTDSITGDKERGTFDSLRLSKTNLSTILFGKTFFVVIVAFFILLVSMISFLFSMKLFTPELFGNLIKCIPDNITWVLSIILILLSMALIATALFALISSFFNKVKHATSYASIGLLVLSLSSMLPSYISLELWDYIPFVNTTSVILAAINNEDCLAKALISLIIGLGAYIVFVLASSRIVEKEEKA